MKLKDAIKELAAIGMSLRKRDGEYRVNFHGGSEAAAYYTDDLKDAVSTGRAMRSRVATKSGKANPSQRVYKPLTAYRVIYADGTSYVTSMAAGVTLADARKYFVGQYIEQPDDSMKRIKAVEPVSARNPVQRHHRRNPCWSASKVARRLRRPGHKKFAAILRKLRKSKKNRGRR